MCGRYHFSFDRMDDIKDMIEGEDWKLWLGLMDKDIHPGDMGPVMVASAAAGPDMAASAATGPDMAASNGENLPENTSGEDRGLLRLCKQKWGFPAPDGKGLVFNARSETVFEKRMFRESVSRRRAAIPVTWFYEWNKNKEKFTFTREDSRVLFLAGFYSVYEDGAHFVILTTEANSSMAPVHSRMPLVLEKDQVKAWVLDGGKTKELLGQIPAGLSRSCEYEQQTLF